MEHIFFDRYHAPVQKRFGDHGMLLQCWSLWAEDEQVESPLVWAWNHGARGDEQKEQCTWCLGRTEGCELSMSSWGGWL